MRGLRSAEGHSRVTHGLVRVSIWSSGVRWAVSGWGDLILLFHSVPSSHCRPKNHRRERGRPHWAVCASIHGNPSKVGFTLKNNHWSVAYGRVKGKEQNISSLSEFTSNFGRCGGKCHSIRWYHIGVICNHQPCFFPQEKAVFCAADSYHFSPGLPLRSVTSQF